MSKLDEFYTEVGKLAIIEKWGFINSRLLEHIAEDPKYYYSKLNDIAGFCDFGDLKTNQRYFSFNKSKKLIFLYNTNVGYHKDEIYVTNVGLTIKISASFEDLGDIDTYLRHNKYSFSVDRGDTIIIKCKKVDGVRIIDKSKTADEFIKDLSKLIYELISNKEKFLNDMKKINHDLIKLAKQAK